MEVLVNNIKLERVVMEVAPRVAKSRLMEHISNPSKEIILINSFIINLKKGLE